MGMTGVLAIVILMTKLEYVRKKVSLDIIIRYGALLQINKFRGFISLWYICWAISDDYKMRLQGHCLRTGATFATVGHAKYACSKDSNCVGVQNPQCDNLISTVCLYAVYQKTKFFTKQYSRKVVSEEYRNCTYIKDNQHVKHII